MPTVVSERINHQLLYRIRNSPRAVLQFNRNKNDLVTWFWPTNERGERVPPPDLWLHRLSHKMMGPCCLCPLNRDNDEFVEVAICTVKHGRYAGEYVATCATDECNYFVFMERIYARRGVPIRHYPLRAVNEPAPPAVTAPEGNGRGRMIEHERMRYMDVVDVRVVRTHPPPVLAPKAVFNLILSLDSATRPGITSAEFESLFARCHGCDLVMTQRIFESHECPTDEAEIVDLTMEE